MSLKNQIFDKNEKGRDFVVGDIHGDYVKFSSALDAVSFDKSLDRVFSVGDLVDRGDDSLKCLELTREKWFNAVRGNHEQMLLDGYNDSIDKLLHLQNGGVWFSGLDAEDKFQCADMIKLMPLSFTVGDIGICHAQPPSKDWKDVLSPSEWHKDNMLWGREWLQTDYSVENIRETYHGHTGVESPTRIGNCNFIDTNYAGGYISLIEI